jgi:signal transduction histidine kinase
VRRLANEQAALRRVATLVARESPAAEVFAAVAEEVGRVLQVQDTRILRYESDETATVLASWGKLGRDIPVGTRWRLDGENVSTKVLRTAQAVRKDYYGDASGDIGDRVQERGIRSAVGTPILVEGRLWGVLLVASLTEEPLPHDAEPRIREFTELVATAISNIETRSELAASRARVVAAADDERRRVVRDLHDGAQQRLVHTVVTLKLAQRALANGDGSAPELVANALTQADSANAELRELAQGILPAVLTRGGLRAGTDALASRSPVPVVVDVLGDRLPTEIEATAYFVVAEALTNVAKHSQATRATVRARSEDGMLRLEVRDNGVGCTASEGSGLIGLRDRLATLNGRLKVDSPLDGGTVLIGEIPVPG